MKNRVMIRDGWTGQDGDLQGSTPFFISIACLVIIKIMILNNDNHHDQITYGGWSHQLGDDVDWHGEDDCAVVLGRDAVQRLQIPQLEKI